MKRYLALNMQEVSQPRDGSTVIVDNWWMCHPEHGIVVAEDGHKGHEYWLPVCNRNELVIHHRVMDRYRAAGLEAVQVPLVFLHYRYPDGWCVDKNLGQTELDLNRQAEQS